MGFAYGGITNDPSVAADYSSIGTGTTIWHWLDIGTLIVPPQILPDGATLGTLTLRLAFYRSSGTGDDGFQCDSVMLLPVDFGSAYTSKTSSADRVVLDGISPAHRSRYGTHQMSSNRAPSRRGRRPSSTRTAPASISSLTMPSMRRSQTGPRSWSGMYPYSSR